MGPLGVVVPDPSTVADHCLRAGLEGVEVDALAFQRPPVKDRKQREALRTAPPPRGRPRKDMTARERMDRRLRTKCGRETYAKRGKTIEPVFGQMKGTQGVGLLMMRGLEACSGEWQLDCLPHNLKKLHVESVRRAEEEAKMTAHRAKWMEKDETTRYNRTSATPKRASEPRISSAARDWATGSRDPAVR